MEPAELEVLTMVAGRVGLLGYLFKSLPRSYHPHYAGLLVDCAARDQLVFQTLILVHQVLLVLLVILEMLEVLVLEVVLVIQVVLQALLDSHSLVVMLEALEMLETLVLEALVALEVVVALEEPEDEMDQTLHQHQREEQVVEEAVLVQVVEVLGR